MRARLNTLGGVHLRHLAFSRLNVCKHTHTKTHAHTNTHAHTHTHTHTHTHMQTMTPFFRNPNDIRRGQSSVLEQACLDKSYVPVYYMNDFRADTHTHTYTHSHMHNYICTLSFFCSLSLIHTHTHLHTHLHTHTHTHTHTRNIHTYAQAGVLLNTPYLDHTAALPTSDPDEPTRANGQ